MYENFANEPIVRWSSEFFNATESVYHMLYYKRFQCCALVLHLMPDASNHHPQNEYTGVVYFAEMSHCRRDAT